MQKLTNVPWPIYIKYGLIKRSRFFVNLFYKLVLLTTPVWKDIKNFKKQIKKHKQFRGTYGMYAKFYIIYNTVRTLKPEYILECGSGISTIIIARAIKENNYGTLISMEEYETFGKIISEIAGNSVQMHISETEETTYDGISGIKYKNIPNYPYTLIFIDGPTTKTVDLDAFYLLEKYPKAKILIDCRVPTIRALQTKYQGGYHQFTNMGYINFQS